jgi:hypothetical protein
MHTESLFRERVAENQDPRNTLDRVRRPLVVGLC